MRILLRFGLALCVALAGCKTTGTEAVAKSGPGSVPVTGGNVSGAISALALIPILF